MTKPPNAAAESHRADQVTDYGNSDIMVAGSTPAPVAVAETLRAAVTEPGCGS